jgi:hypothetical protein
LNELKATTSRFETIQLLNEQIDSMDRKMRSVAIKRAEAIKVKFSFQKRVVLVLGQTRSDRFLVFRRLI